MKPRNRHFGAPYTPAGDSALRTRCLCSPCSTRHGLGGVLGSAQLSSVGERERLLIHGCEVHNGGRVAGLRIHSDREHELSSLSSSKSVDERSCIPLRLSFLFQSSGLWILPCEFESFHSPPPPSALPLFPTQINDTLIWLTSLAITVSRQVYFLPAYPFLDPPAFASTFS